MFSRGFFNPRWYSDFTLGSGQHCSEQHYSAWDTAREMERFRAEIKALQAEESRYPHRTQVKLKLRQLRQQLAMIEKKERAAEHTSRMSKKGNK